MNDDEARTVGVARGIINWRRQRVGARRKGQEREREEGLVRRWLM